MSTDIQQCPKFDQPVLSSLLHLQGDRIHLTYTNEALRGKVIFGIPNSNDLELLALCPGL